MIEKEKENKQKTDAIIRDSCKGKREKRLMLHIIII
jgi:hypothetical protein